MPNIKRWIRASLPGPAWHRAKSVVFAQCLRHLRRRGTPLCLHLSHEIVEVPFGADATAHPENVRGRMLRVQRDEITGAAPEIASAGKHVIHLVRGFGWQAE